MKEAGLKKEKYTYVNFLLFHVALLLKGLNLLFLFRKQRQHSSGSPYIYQTNFLVNWILEKILRIEYLPTVVALQSCMGSKEAVIHFLYFQLLIFSRGKFAR